MFVLPQTSRCHSTCMSITCPRSISLPFLQCSYVFYSHSPAERTGLENTSEIEPALQMVSLGSLFVPGHAIQLVTSIVIVLRVGGSQVSPLDQGRGVSWDDGP